MHERWTERLSDYLDDELPPRERTAIEAHLASCPACTALLAELRQVVAEARTLASKQPDDDLWSPIAARLQAERRSPARQPVRAALAAAAIVALAAGWMVWERRPGSGITPGLESTESEPAPPQAAAGWRRDEPLPADSGVAGAVEPLSVVTVAAEPYDTAIADLERALEASRDSGAGAGSHFAPGLRIMDVALEEATEAWLTDRTDVDLGEYLAATRRRKIDLLRRAAALSGERE